MENTCPFFTGMENFRIFRNNFEIKNGIFTILDDRLTSTSKVFIMNSYNGSNDNLFYVSTAQAGGEGKCYVYVRDTANPNTLPNNVTFPFFVLIYY